MPNSIVGPPQNVAITPDESLALVTSSTRIDPADGTKTVPDDKLTVIDLRATPPAVLVTLRAGNGASGVSINRAGTLALVANRFAGTVSVFTIAGKAVTAAGTVEVGTPESLLSGVVFTRDGRMALVTRNNDSLVSVLSIDGTRVENAKRDFAANLKPYGIDVSPAGDTAIIASIGVGATGGSDTLTVIDLTVTPPRAVNHVSVGPVAEGLAISPDGRHVAVTVMNGSNAAKSSPFFHDFGWLRVYAVNKVGAGARRRNADRALVPGSRMERGRAHGPGAVRRRAGDQDVRIRRPAARRGSLNQGGRRTVGDSDRSAVTVSNREQAPDYGLITMATMRRWTR